MGFIGIMLKKIFIKKLNNIFYLKNIICKKSFYMKYNINITFNSSFLIFYF